MIYFSVNVINLNSKVINFPWGGDFSQLPSAVISTADRPLGFPSLLRYNFTLIST
jgi:hypothetical protein